MATFTRLVRLSFLVCLAAAILLQGCGETKDQESAYEGDTQSPAEAPAPYETSRYEIERPTPVHNHSSVDLSSMNSEESINDELGYGGAVDSGLKTSRSSETYREVAPVELHMEVESTPKSNSFSITRPRHDTSSEGYTEIVENGFLSVSESPRSTFSIDVDTASYSNVRRFLESGQLPPADAVRVEELINYFTYDDQPPQNGRPFSVSTEVAECPWNRQRKLVRIGLKGQIVERAERQPANLVFLIDVSGSMRTQNKLPLVKRALHRLLEELDQRDRISIVTYASGVRTVLSPTPANQQHRISQAIDSLVAGGSTNGSAGLQLAYQVARQEFVKFGTNRVILCSDGDFNVGITDQKHLIDLISQAAKTDIFLSVLGFGTGNYKDSIAEKLADHGNGNYAYIDSYSEARKVLVEQMTGTLETIAKDVKIQVEFNPANVASYRLIGYENRKLATKDFRDDKKDAGEIGAGHSVTALYEVVPPNAETPEASDIPELKYQKTEGEIVEDHLDELLTVRLRYKLPTEEIGNEFAHPVMNEQQAFNEVSANFRFATSVAAFGMILRDSQFASNITWGDVRHWAQTSLGQDEQGYRSEFLNLLAQAERLIYRPTTRSEVEYLPNRKDRVKFPAERAKISGLSSRVDLPSRSLLNSYDSETLLAMLVVILMASCIAAFSNRHA